MPASECDKQKNHTNTIFSNLQLVHIVYLTQTLHAIELVEAIKKGANHFFDPTHSFSYRVHGKIWPS